MYIRNCVTIILQRRIIAENFVLKCIRQNMLFSIGIITGVSECTFLKISYKREILFCPAKILVFF